MTKSQALILTFYQWQRIANEELAGTREVGAIRVKHNENNHLINACPCCNFNLANKFTHYCSTNYWISTCPMDELWPDGCEADEYKNYPSIYYSWHSCENPKAARIIADKALELYKRCFQ